MSDEIKYIKKIEISKLWGKFDIEWNLHPDVNILAGGNGSGKSTILNVILKCLGYHYLHSSIFNIKSIEIVFDTTKNIIFRHTQGVPEVKMPPLSTKTVNYIAYQNNAVLMLASGFSHELKGGLTECDKDTFEALQKWNIDYINIIDQLLKDKESILKISENTALTAFDWEIYQLQKKYLDYQLNLSKKKDLIVDKNENVKEGIDKLRYPQNRFLDILDELFGETGKKVDRTKNEISFLLDNQIEIQSYQLSSGEKQMLYILLTTLVQDNKQTFFFMDEPETSLHIEWQKKLISFIRELNPNIQLIIATHSPAIIMNGWFDKVFNVADIIVKNHQTINK